MPLRTDQGHWRTVPARPEWEHWKPQNEPVELRGQKTTQQCQFATEQWRTDSRGVHLIAMRGQADCHLQSSHLDGPILGTPERALKQTHTHTYTHSTRARTR